MCDVLKTPCCIAINEAVASFNTQLNQALADGIARVNQNFPPPSVEGSARNALALAAITSIASQFRAAIDRLNMLSQICNSPCCESAARALAETAAAFVGLVSTGAANPAIPLVPSQDNPNFYLLAALARLVGSAAFPAGTPGLPPGLPGTLSENLNLILSTVNCPPCNVCTSNCCTKTKIRPCRKNY